MERLKLSAEEDKFFTECIERAEEERTQAALQDDQNIWKRAEEQRTQRPNIKPSIKSTSRDISYRARNLIRGIVNDVIGDGRHVHFNLKKNSTKLFHNKDELRTGKWRDGSPKNIPKHRNMEGTTKPTALARSEANSTCNKEPAPAGTRREKRKLMKKKKVRQKREDMLRPHKKLTTEKKAGKRVRSKHAPKEATKPKEDHMANAATRQRKPPGWKRRLLSFLYNSGAGGNYPTEALQQEAGLSIIRPSTK